MFAHLHLQGIAPILPIFREGILNGPPEVKESAALGLGEVIRKTSSEALKSSVVNITGPLIRILGDRFSHSVKVAMLDTLGLLLGKVRSYSLCMTAFTVYYASNTVKKDMRSHRLSI